MMQSFPPPPAGSSRAARVLSSGNIRVPALVRITHTTHKHSTSPGSNCKTIICSPAAAGSAVAGPAVTGPQLLVHLAAGVGIGVVGMI